MKKTILILLAAVLLISPTALAKPKKDYNTITEGEIFYSAGHYLAGEPIPTGYDPYGYNYQAHLFKGSYYNAYAGGAGFPPYTGDDDVYLAENPDAENHWAWPYRDIKLVMKWNDIWLSNKDRNCDGKLDRGLEDPYTSSASPGAWVTNHQSGGEGKDHWTYYVKIVCPMEDATLTDGTWYTPDGTEIGPVIWGAYAIIQQVESGLGATYVSPASAGLGYYK